MIDGAGFRWTSVKGEQALMPNPASGYYAAGFGHLGHGAARISSIVEASCSLPRPHFNIVLHILFFVLLPSAHPWMFSDRTWIFFEI
jgi:hypothetical protein